MKRILIATDGSPSAQQAVEFGVDLAKHEDAAIAVVYVVSTAAIVAMNGFGIAGYVPYELTADDEAVLDDAAAVADREGVAAVSKLLRGDPVTEIVQYADLLGADLIVVGSRGRGAIAAAMLGSVSRGVLARAKRPVLVVRSAEVAEPAEPALALAAST